MNETTVIKLGHPVPNFDLEAYFPAKEDFGKISLEQLKKDNKWTILFFYPADFTFV
jgi:alkyl hydroperoxide reductase subunit AhpC